MPDQTVFLTLSKNGFKVRFPEKHRHRVRLKQKAPKGLQTLGGFSRGAFVILHSWLVPRD
jgi:hypothetical protein